MRAWLSVPTIFCVMSASDAAFTQDYPNRPIRIATGAAGGPSDFTARLVAQGISAPLGQPVIVENRASLVAIDTVAKSAPDGYTLAGVAGNFWSGPLIEKRSYDPLRSFTPIAQTVTAPNVLVVSPALQVTSVKDLIALAKSRPGALKYGSTASGSSSHLAAELFRSAAGIDIVRIPYKAIGQALVELAAGDLQLLFASTGTNGLPATLKSGKVRPLAVTQASSMFPNLPTVAASGLPGYESGAAYAMFAPAKTSPAIIKRLNQEIVRTLRTNESKERLLTLGLEVVASTPEQLASMMKSEMAVISKLVKQGAIKAEE